MSQDGNAAVAEQEVAPPPAMTLAQEKGWTVDVSTVRWFRSGNPHKVGVVASSLEVSLDGNRRLLPFGSNQTFNGVRHIDDPWLDKHPECKRDSGAWDYTEETKRLFALEGRLATLTGEVDRLQAVISNLPSPEPRLAALTADVERLQTVVVNLPAPKPENSDPKPANRPSHGK